MVIVGMKDVPLSRSCTCCRLTLNGCRPPAVKVQMPAWMAEKCKLEGTDCFQLCATPKNASYCWNAKCLYTQLHLTQSLTYLARNFPSFSVQSNFFSAFFQSMSGCALKCNFLTPWWEVLATHEYWDWSVSKPASCWIPSLPCKSINLGDTWWQAEYTCSCNHNAIVNFQFSTSPTRSIRWLYFFGILLYFCMYVKHVSKCKLLESQLLQLAPAIAGEMLTEQLNPSLGSRLWTSCTVALTGSAGICQHACEELRGDLLKLELMSRCLDGAHLW